MTSEQAREHELEEFAALYCKYTLLCDDMATAMQDDSKAEVDEAYERVSMDFLDVQRVQLSSGRARTPEQIQLDLDALAETCEIEAESLDDCVLVSHAASTYVRTMMRMISAPPRSPDDSLKVIQMATQMLLQEHDGEPRFPEFLPRQIKLVPDNPTTRRVFPDDIEYWRSHPSELTRKGFMMIECEANNGIGDVFFVLDHAVKHLGGSCYEVQHEALGEEVFTYKAEHLLEMIAEAELVTNMTR
ncbi:hypothetical protein Hypma_005564 [Hypsizygus marmoreus]|uniref:Uncharacterized protein n=1 Tax=Hypsizygus marmoreus TaxID=39966 RepID=A0A369JW99_HYPMA|nr:hypothetical protein Hypma_005564 [Hypsizygus marmoreus]